MKNLISISFSENASDEIFLQAITDDSLYSCFESFSESESLSNLPIMDLTEKISLFELPEPDLEIPFEKIESKPSIHLPQIINSFSSPERQVKIQRYLEKKRKRTWHKKIHYSCRKKVADQRIRVKGRFVSKKQAVTLGFPISEFN